MFRLEGKRRKQPCVPNVEKRVAKKKKIYTPTQSPSSDAEPPMKQQVIATFLHFIIYLFNHK